MAIEIGLIGWLAEGCFQAEHEVDPAYWFLGFAVIPIRLHQFSKRAADVRAQAELAEAELVAG